MRSLTLSLLFIASAALAQPHQMVPDPLKHLMLDTRVIYRAVNARLTPGTVVKEPRNPLFQTDKPWENATNNLYPNVLWDEQEQVFKMWYKCVLADKGVIARMDKPSTIHDVGWYLLYATSKDGLTWDKPALGLHAFNGDAGTNIVARDTPNAGVFKDLHDADPARRYKMVYDIGLGQPRVRFSADGMHWGDPVEVQGIGAAYGDTHNNALWDERSGKYLWFTKLYLGERTVARFESADFLHWQGSGMVLRSTVEEGKQSQTYCLPVFRYANVYLGYTMMYHIGAGRSVDCELAWSPDSIHWQRIAPGTPFIPRGAKGAYDSECLYAMAGPPVASGNDLLLYYGVDHIPHLGWKRSCLPCLARLPLDHFAGYEQADKARPATLFSAQFAVTGQPLRITADATGGRLSIAALDELGVTMDDTFDITGNVIDQEVKWRHGGLAELKGNRLHLQFELTGGAKLYAFSGLEMVNTALPQPLNPLRSPHRTAAPVSSQTATTTPPAIPFAGDWSQRFGGMAATLTLPATDPKARVEIFAKDIASWSHPAAPSLTVRYGWTDAEAAEAGWVRGPTAFSWTDTLTHVGKVVLTPTTTAEITVSGEAK